MGWLPGSAGQLFFVQHAPSSPCSIGRGLLIVPPFGEEMNRCRRMMSIAARAVAARGCAALIVDLFGTGDSEGDFGDASFDQWGRDLSVSVEHLHRQGIEVIDLLALRAGALLLDSRLAEACGGPGRVVLWQPVTSGRQHANQLLRLKLAEGVVGRGAGEGMARLRERLAQSGEIEIAGYRTSAGLIAEMERRDLGAGLPVHWRDIAWLEIGPAESTDVTPASARTVAALRSAGASLEARTVQGDPFWGTPEVAVVPALIDATAVFLAGATNG